ncbi:glycoside hydrolase family 92 protein [Aureibaculum marinum]|uniref:Glycoside hydrolase family 92 protein n=1 Tax=Aureibaculum marinum TaxID=2487930 RepID=A0A3N4NX24_9FLAO|nr:GH92 family glycosyl hydrolase [Aureibaculum marinum]RPD98798.1 glycoside hydrolase family 92 protein [Aureibaculum marinum]
MKHLKIIFLFLINCLIISCKSNNEEQQLKAKTELLTSFVNPFIGTGGHGHTYPGASAPFGMVQPSPDNGTPGWDWCSGYHISDTIISGFSQLHLSGTGIGDLVDVLLMPTNKEVNLKYFSTTRDSLPYTSYFSHDNEEASPGYYRVKLNNNIQVELTANDYVAFHKYTFNNSELPSFIIDLGFALNWDKATSTSLNLIDNNRITGTRFSTGWAKNQKVFFVIETSKPIQSSKFIQDGKVVSEVNSIKGIKTGGQFTFDKSVKEVEVKIALSSVSIENAIDNLDKKASNTNFNDARLDVQEKWEAMLSKIRIKTDKDSLKTIFYTALYHAQLAPVLFNDVNGEFRLQNDSIVKTSNFNAYSTLSLWDVFRAETPLLSIIDSQRLNDIIRSMLVYYDEQGTLPVWTLYGNETGTMPGYHSISVIADAYLKGIRDYDVEKAYQAMKNTMMGDVRGLNHYKKYGYIPYNKEHQSVSITLNYAYNDYCVAQMAKDLGKEDDYKLFLNRSKAYENFFDKESGFLRGKSPNGKDFREPFNPKMSNHLEDTDYTEGNAWQHSWNVIHDTEGLINLHGGNENFAEKTNQLFLESSELVGDNVSADITGLIGQYAHGNEPSHHIAYMFNKAKQPWRTQYWVREILNTQYSTKPDGLSGNEDAGQMSAWYILSSIGIYPMNPVSGEYQIGSPIFDEASIKTSSNTTFKIITKNNSDLNIYIQSAKLNNEELNRTYITHKELMSGGTLELEMGAEPNKNWPKN